MLLFATYVSWSVAHFFKDLRPLLEMHALFKDKLHICDTDLQAIQWDTIVQRIVDLQQTSRLCIVKDQLTATLTPTPTLSLTPTPTLALTPTVTLTPTLAPTPTLTLTRRDHRPGDRVRLPRRQDRHQQPRRHGRRLQRVAAYPERERAAGSPEPAP